MANLMGIAEVFSWAIALANSCEEKR